MIARWVPAKCAPPAALLLCLCGCAIETSGPIQHDYRTIELDQSEAVRVNVEMGAGNLRVDSGTQKLMRADFSYNNPSWKPYVHYDSGALRGNLTIRQPETGGTHIRSAKAEWDIRLNREVPLDLHVNFGAGHADLNLGSLTLHSVDVNMGVGQLNLDLRGSPQRNYDVHVQGGVGEAVVRLPAEVGVEAEAEGGIGSITAQGMRQDGHLYRNDAFEHAKVRVHLEIHGGVGAIRLIAE